MYKLLLFEIRKIYRSKSFWVCLLTVIGVVVLSLLTVSVLNDTVGNEVTIGSENKGATLSVESDQQFSGVYVLISSLNIQVPLILSIFVPLFVASDFAQGIMKVLVAKGYSRLSIYSAKFLGVVIATAIFSGFCLLSAAVTGTIIWGFGSGVDSRYVMTLLSQFMVLLSYSALYMMISVIIRKTGIAIAVSVALMTVLNMIFSFVTSLSDKIEIEKYHLPQILTTLSTQDVKWSVICQSFIVSIAYIFVCYIIGFLFFKKRDVA